MAFCTSCGADVTGKNFCVSCGRPVGSGQPASVPQPQPAVSGSVPPAPPAQAAYAPIPPGAPIPKRGVSPVVWVLVGIFGFFLLIGIVFTVGVGMFVHKVKQNPVAAAAKLLTLGNPDVEVLDTNERNNTVTLRDKKTHETITVNLDDIKQGKIVFKDNKGQTATIQANADAQNGTLEVKGPDGSVKFGAGAGANKVPDWVPAYPGVSPQANFSMQSNDGEAGNLTFSTKDSPDAVLAFYQKGLEQAGFKITSNIAGNAGGHTGGMISGEHEASKHNVIVIVGTDSGNTGVNVSFSTKK
jgi:hypothetical protein